MKQLSFSPSGTGTQVRRYAGTQEKFCKISQIILIMVSLFLGQYSFAQDNVACANETVQPPVQTDSLCGRVVQLCIFCPQDNPTSNYYYVCLPAGWQAVHGTLITSGLPFSCTGTSQMWRLDRPTSWIGSAKCFSFVAPTSDVVSGGTFSFPLWRYVSSPTPTVYTYPTPPVVTLVNTYITSVSLSVSPNPVCVGSPATISLPASSTATTSHFSITPSTYTLTGGGSSFTFTASATGTYTIKYENMDNCEYGTTTVNVIAAPATPVISTTAINNCNPFTVCIGTVESGVTYSWTVGNGTYTGSTPCINVTATSTGSPTTVTVTATNGCGTTTSNTLNIAPCEPPRCDASVSYNQTGEYILGPGTYTWNGTSNPWGVNPVRINGNLIIKSNATLNLRNITLEFSPRSKIVVEDTARLDMRANTVLKAVADCMWQGVENISSTNAGVPGLVYMRNSTIRDAITGISLGQKGGGLVQYSAGLVNIQNSTFLNNHISIHYKANLSNSYLTRPGAIPLHSVQNTLFRCDGSLKLIFDLTNNPSNRSQYFQKIDVPIYIF